MKTCHQCKGSGLTSLLAGPGYVPCGRCDGAGEVLFDNADVEAVARSIALNMGRQAAEWRLFHDTALAAMDVMHRSQKEIDTGPD